ncbi:MAG: ribonuclease HI [Candidatus Levybacteria bacterium CG10_big_fil_rev_8_21_14_0_10_36_7]|nr:MAG: ribonuclease HI [Candidatus Levybacteria bacterium CG10_big_fil_rev_8_21_14_0_10_36_7]
MANGTTYIVYSDGGSRGNPGEAAYGFVVYDENKKILKEQGERIGINTNNVAEYMGVVSALKWLKNNGGKDCTINFFLDSELVASQLNGVYKVKNENLRSLFFTVKSLQQELEANITYKAIRREFNKEADRMVNLALDNEV